MFVFVALFACRSLDNFTSRSTVSFRMGTFCNNELGVLCSSAYGFSLIVQWYLGLLWVSYRCGVGATVLYGAFELASLSPLVHACRQ
jgi:hypothetical protein